jgi:glycogen synthase
LPEATLKDKKLIHKNKFNFLKAGLEYADYINTVSETYAKKFVNMKILLLVCKTHEKTQK